MRSIEELLEMLTKLGVHYNLNYSPEYIRLDIFGDPIVGDKIYQGADGEDIVRHYEQDVARVKGSTALYASLSDVIERSEREGIVIEYESKSESSGAVLRVLNDPLFANEMAFEGDSNDVLVALYNRAIVAEGKKKKPAYNFNGDPADLPLDEPIPAYRPSSPKDLTKCEFDSAYANKIKNNSDLLKEVGRCFDKSASLAKGYNKDFIDHSDFVSPYNDYMIDGVKHRYNVGDEPESVTGKTARALGLNVDPLPPFDPGEIRPEVAKEFYDTVLRPKENSSWTVFIVILVILGFFVYAMSTLILSGRS